MLSSLFESRPQRSRDRPDRSPFASSYARTATPSRDLRPGHRRVIRYEDESHSPNSSSASGQESDGDSNSSWADVDRNDNNEEVAPLLPIFDSSHLDTLPVYNLTHTIRLLVWSRCDTVLTWEQLRSPQVSQFLIKPIQQEIRTGYFSAATIYCLMANCLQFTKETDTNPGNSGTIHTRAMVCELLAIKLLKEYSTRDLIDALSYDFNPLQGQSDLKVSPLRDHRPSWQSINRGQQSRSACISCLEIAIRAQAKRFLAHPSVVQQLEAIWDGSIVFHAAADSMHRMRAFPQPNYGTQYAPHPRQGIADGKQPSVGIIRRVVTLYNPRDASLFKLSRLRVPRYRNIISTFSFAVLLSLFIAVLVQRSLHITILEVIFWVWAGGYMIDEIVGFSEQGIFLYLASFWNVMDLGIVFILFVHLCLRFYGILMPDIHKRSVADKAFDLLAADAILLFPRLFSVLDHYRYFSQLIIAFRLMAADFAAVLVLLVIFCSGFFVALTLSFGYDGTDSASDVAYALLQMVLGFTPAVWDRWNSYTPLGRTILVSFLTFCHFLILTILITVLTNSFMAVVKNANEEHQFLFAVNTISAVKSDSLFSYMPPLNVLQWMLHPLRYVLPFRQYIKLNRTVIKLTHLPILSTIYLYERTVLQSMVVDRIDVIENRTGQRSVTGPRSMRPGNRPSQSNLRQDQALEEVFRNPIDATLRTEILNNRQKSSTVVNQWMHDMGEQATSPPQEEDPKTVDRLERRRLGERSLSTFSRFPRYSQRAISVASDPAYPLSHGGNFSPKGRGTSNVSRMPSAMNLDLDPQTDADGDDELQTDDNDDDQLTTDQRSAQNAGMLPAVDYFTHVSLSTSKSSPHARSLESGGRNVKAHLESLHSGWSSSEVMTVQKRPHQEMRNVSSATVIHNPTITRSSGQNETDVPSSFRAAQSRLVALGSNPASSGAGKKSPKAGQQAKARTVFPLKDNQAFRSVPDLTGLVRSDEPEKQRRSSLEMDLVSDIGDNKAIGGGYVGAIPASFATQMAYAAGGLRQLREERKEDQERFSRLVMARMNSLEEGFRDVIHEMRENMKSTPGSKNRSPERPAQVRRDRRAAAREEKARGRGTISPNLREGEVPGTGSPL